MCDIDAEAGRTEAAGLGDLAIFIQGDAASFENQAAAFERVWETWGRLDFGSLHDNIPLMSSSLDALTLGASRRKCRHHRFGRLLWPFVHVSAAC
jgi:hypothetical protein